ncbi:MAG: hypothetical protein HRU19_13310 [Pseudobacteriovorax sp.]|nr:hypothetical protein [Pseudobacteriovorax sp.]
MKLKGILTTLSILFCSQNAFSKVTSVEKLSFDKGSLKTSVSYFGCEDQTFDLRIDSCQSTYPLTCQAEIVATEDFAKSCALPKNQEAEATFVLSEQLRGIDFLLRFPVLDQTIIIGDLIRKTVPIKSITIHPRMMTNGQDNSLMISAYVLKGDNPCKAEGVRPRLSYRTEDDLLIVRGEINYSLVELNQNCLPSNNEEVWENLQLRISKDPSDIREIVIENLSELGRHHSVNPEIETAVAR